MWVTRQVEIPEALMRAQQEGNLVLFVGAGASMAPPSALPSFTTLARSIAADAHVPCTEEDARNPNQYLSTLADAGISVHEHARRLIAERGAPNALHRALVALFPTVDAVRIVTTNWDKHLTAAAEERFGHRPAVYHAPALPLGRDFSGIVHLHGCTDQRPQDLIMTEADFGRAYLTDAWASGFVREMFRAYTVVFIGYSNDDVIMYYLGRGLTTPSPRYGFIAEPSRNWTALGITSIVYPPADDHIAQSDALTAWAELVNTGYLEHERRIVRLLAGSAPQAGTQAAAPWDLADPADDSYMHYVVQDEELVKLFTRHAAGPDVLAWISRKPSFHAIFDPRAELTAAAQQLAFWFAREYASSESDSALAVARERGGALHPVAALHVVRELAAHHPPSSVVALWLPLLLAGHVAPSTLAWLLGSLRRDEDLDTALLLLDQLITPRPVPTTSPLATLRTSFGFDVAMTAEDYALGQAWTTYFAPRLEQVADTLMPMVERHLRTAHLLLRAGGQAGRDRDLISLQRASIAPHAQDIPPTGLDLLIDIARDSLAALTRTAPRQATALMTAWVSGDVPLLRRLALHGCTQRTDQSADEKIDWLVRSGTLYDLLARPEVFALLAAAAPRSQASRANLLAAIAHGPTRLAMPERRDEVVMSVLEWVTRHAPDFTQAQQVLSELQAAHPDFTPSPDPGPLFSVTSMSFDDRSPRSVQQLLSMTGTQDDLQWLRSYHGGSGLFGPTRDGLLAEITRAASADLSWSLTIVGALAESGDRDSDLWPAVIHGWRQALPRADAADADAALDLLGAPGTRMIFRAATDLLAALTAQQDADLGVVEHCERLAAHLWNLARGEKAPDLPGMDTRGSIVFAALNHWSGDLASTFLQAAAQRWRADRDNFAGLPAVSRRCLEQMLDASFPGHLGTLSILTRSFPLLCALDEPWTSEQVLTGFDWARPDDPGHSYASAAWEGFLSRPAWNERLLSLLAPHLPQTFHMLGGEPRKALVDTMATVAFAARADEDLVPNLIAEFIGATSELERASWSGRVGWLLDKLPAQDAEDAWGLWIAPYWQRRLEHRPRALSAAETEQMLTWVTASGRSFPEAVKALTASPAEFHGAYLFFNALRSHRALDDFPREAGELLAYVLEHTKAPVDVCEQIGVVINRLIQRAAPGSAPSLEAACHAAGRLGCPDAASWLIRMQAMG